MSAVISAIGRPIGSVYSDVTDAESAAGVTPVNYQYDPGHVLRYGTNTDPGTTDMTSAIQAAITQSAQANGAPAYVPAGVYKTTDTLNLVQYGVIRGDGYLTQINYSGASSAILASAATLTEWRRTEVSGLNVITSTGTDGIQVNNLAELEIARNIFYGFSRASIHLTGTAGQACICIWIHHNEVFAGTGDAILLDGVNNVNQITIHSNRLTGCTGYGIKSLVSGRALSIVGNDIESNSAGQIYCYLVAGVDISGNYFESHVAQPCIVLSDSFDTSGISIRGNFFQSNIDPTNVITLGVSAFVRGVDISGNSFSGTFTNAISAAAVVGGRFGPNYVQAGTHLTVGASSSGIEELGTAGLAIKSTTLVNQRKAVSYSGSMTIDATTGNEFDITATNGTAFTINAPTTPKDGQRITITLRNTSGGALGAATWDAVFKMSAWTNPGNANSRSIDFRYDGTNWVQVSQTGVDVPN